MALRGPGTGSRMDRADLGPPNVRVPGELALGLLRSGYRAIPAARRAAGGAPDFRTRLLGRRAVVVAGRDAVRCFYDPALIRRTHAVPPPLGWLLFGKGAVHSLDGAEHAHRKHEFLRLLDHEAAAEIAGLVDAGLADRLHRELHRSPRVFNLLVEVYGAAVLSWAGVAATGGGSADRSDDAAVSHGLAAIVDGFGGAGTAYLRAWKARLAANRWARARIEEARSLPSGSHRPTRAVDVIAQWRSADGELLPTPVAAVELLNVLRPAVAVAYLGTYAVGALADHPASCRRLAEPDAHAERRAFAHEVRRLAPFVPALTGLTRTTATWSGLRLPRSHRVVLDVPGTNRDPRRWPEPTRFDPGRFLGREIDAFEFVPQGGGDPRTGHRCPGEPATVAMLEATIERFAATAYRVLQRGHDDTRIPARDRLAVLVGPMSPSPAGAAGLYAESAPSIQKERT